MAVDPADFGDAPSPYATTQADGGPTHAVNPSGPRLGSNIDYEADAVIVDADNANPSDGDDGVRFLTSISSAESVVTRSAIAIQSETGGQLTGWIDFDADGTFDQDEQVVQAEVAAGTTVLPIDIPAGLNPGTVWSRFRIASEVVTSPTDAVADGEVEDYPLAIVAGTELTVRGDATVVGGNRITIDTINDELVITLGDQTILQTAAAAGQTLTVQSLPTATVVIVNALPPSGNLRLVGGESIDTLLYNAPVPLELLDDGPVQITDYEAIDFGDASGASLRLDAVSLTAAASDAGLTLVGDDLRVTPVAGEDGEIGFRVGSPVSGVLGQFITPITVGDAGFGLVTTAPFQNPLSEFDVNGDGDLTPIDALLIINELRRRSTSGGDESFAPLDQTPFDGRFLDVSGDNRLQPLDALRVINQLRRENLGGGSGEAIQIDQIRERDDNDDGVV